VCDTVFLNGSSRATMVGRPICESSMRVLPSSRMLRHCSISCTSGVHSARR